jgi:hypothetical protein
MAADFTKRSLEMTESEKAVAKILIRVANGDVTIEELKRRLAKAITYIEVKGAQNLPLSFIHECAIVENAVKRLDRAKARRMNG